MADDPTMSSISVTCPQRIQITNRKARNRQRWRSPLWKQRVQEHIIGKPCECYRYFGPNIQPCGKPANTPHHDNGEDYEDDERYMDPANWIPFNSSCHHNLHKGLVRCPECGGWMHPGRVRCSRCDGWSGAKARRKRNGHRINHACGNCIGKQRCRRKKKDGRVGLYICPHSSRKAEADCEHFVRRVKK